MWFLLRHNQPYYMNLFVTARCNARCAYCLNKSRQQTSGPELRLEELERIAAKWPCLKILSLTGGEPFLRPDLMEIIRMFARVTGVPHVSIHTNGCDPAALDAVLEETRRLPALRLINVCLAIDGIGERHDAIRGVPGLYERCVECIRIVQRHNGLDRRVDLVVGTVLVEENVDHVEEVWRHLTEEQKVVCAVGVDRYATGATRERLLAKFRELYARRPYYRAKYPAFSLRAFRQALDSLVPEEIAKVLRDGQRRTCCVAGTNLLVVYEDGTVAPCEMRPDVYGNLRDFDYDVKRLLRAPAARTIRRSIERRECCCLWENPMPFNVLYTPAMYPRAARRWVRQQWGRQEGE